MNIFITGGTSGIAFEVAKKLASQNHVVYIGTHTKKEYKNLKVKLKNYKNLIPIKFDVTKDIDKLSKFDIDVLYLHAGIGQGGSISEIPINKVRENYEVNVFSNFSVLQVVLKNMIKKGKGKIVIMASLLGIMPFKFLGIYSSTKASIISLTTALRKEIKMINKNIHICLIEPGAYRTGFNQIMLNNKYDFMKNDSYFKGQIRNIRKKEELLWKLMEKKNLNSIVNKIVKCILTKSNKFIYRAPISQVIFVKLYNLFKM